MLARPRSLDEWQTFFDTMFRETNQRFHREPDDFLDRMSEILGYVTSEKHQQFNTENYRRFYAKFVAWSCGFITARGARLSDVMIQRFPGVCPYCLKPDCILNANPLASPHKEIDHGALADKITPRVRTTMERLDLEGWRAELFKIYTRNYHRDIGVFVDKVHEEQSELRYALRKLKNGSDADQRRWSMIVKHEFADVFAWFLGLGYHVFFRTQPWQMLIRKQTLDDIVFAPYSRGCPDCEHEVCDCKDPDASLRSSLSSAEVGLSHPGGLELPFPGAFGPMIIIAGQIDMTFIESFNNSANMFVEGVQPDPSLTDDDIADIRKMMNQIATGLAGRDLSPTVFEAICEWFKRKGGDVADRFKQFLTNVRDGLVANGLWEIVKNTFGGMG